MIRIDLSKHADNKQAHERCSASGELHIKTMRCYKHLFDQLKSKTLTTSNTAKGVEQLELSLTADGNAKQYNHFGRQPGSFLQS